MGYGEIKEIATESWEVARNAMVKHDQEIHVLLGDA